MRPIVEKILALLIVAAGVIAGVEIFLWATAIPPNPTPSFLSGPDVSRTGEIRLGWDWYYNGCGC
jgi:hypothetical protein